MPRRDWLAGLLALGCVVRDENDTGEVFGIMRALEGDATARGYARLIATHEGGRIAYQRDELVGILADRTWLATFAPSTLGAAYRDFTARGGVSSEGLADISADTMGAWPHTHGWYGRRVRDAHDLWHMLTG